MALTSFRADEAIPDGQKLSVSSRELGNTEVYAQTLQHSPNGRCAPFLCSVVRAFLMSDHADS